MSVFYVFQGDTYDVEHRDSYVWSPQLDKAGHKSSGFTNMTLIRQGDFILHNKNGKIVAISIAQTDCQEASRPAELQSAATPDRWNCDGYRVNTSYHEFASPVVTTKYRNWLRDHFIVGSAFTQNGVGKQQYMCNLADEHAVFLLNKAIELNRGDPTVTGILTSALDEIIGDRISEYTNSDIEAIAAAIEGADPSRKPVWEGKKVPQAMTVSPHTSRPVPKRNPQCAADALQHAGYKCEYEPGDRTFHRKNGIPYTEPHHLIPLSKYRDFEYSLDVMENIVSLCSHCHNLLHYGSMEEKEQVLQNLYEQRIAALRSCGLNITYDKLKSYYE